VPPRRLDKDISVEPRRGPTPWTPQRIDKQHAKRAALQQLCRRATSEVVALWETVAFDPAQGTRDRLRASELLMAYAWGRPQPQAEEQDKDTRLAEVPAGLRAKLEAILRMHREPPVLEAKPEEP
jgi:hypothetical protein